MNETYELLEQHLEKASALTAALTLFQWDMETLAPKEAADQTAKFVGVLSDEYFKTLINDEVRGLLEKLEKEDASSRSDKENGIIRELRKTYDQLESIPSEEYKEYSELTLKASSVWAEARENNDFAAFAPYIEKIIAFKKKFASYRKKEGQGLYDVLLEEYEPSFSMKELDVFFDLVKKELVPLIQQVVANKDEVNDDFNYLSYDIEKQKEFCTFVTEYIGFDKNRGIIAESAHPFTTNLHNKDVRITNHFYENNLSSAILSTIHEGGHAIYEMNISDDLTQTILGTGASMGIHESQSRFYENIIGKNLNFWIPIYPKLQSMFPEQLGEVTVEEFVRGLRKSQPSLIRTEADELTYPLHILIRYELEKMIFHDEITVEELPAAWNDKYEEYLGIRPTSDQVGVLQDTHWSWGDFGYFPSYAIGSAIAAQLYYYMKTVMPMDELLLEGNLTPIKEFLGENIHQHGLKYNVKELIRRTVGTDFDPNYYVQYMKEIYYPLYHIK